MIAAIYVRVSTDEQAKSGYSLGDQVAVCRQKLLSLGFHDIREYIDDGYSGEFLDRPALDNLRTDLSLGLAKHIMIYDPDRLSRNLTNQLVLADEFEKAGAKLYFVTGDYDSSPEGRLFFSIRGAISAFEKAKIRERTTRGKRAKALQGKIIQNSQPFGYDWDADKCLYIINENEAEAVRQMYDMLIAKKMGTYRITQELQNLGIKTRKGTSISPRTVNNILTKEMYYGNFHQFRVATKKTGQKTREFTKTSRKEQVSIPIPAIISKETFEAARRQLDANKSLSKRNTKRNYLLQGILYCPVCGRRLSALCLSAVRKKTGRVYYYYYICISELSPSYRATDRCGARRIPADELEDLVWNTMIDIASGSKNINDYLRIEESKDYSQEIKELRAQRDEAEQIRATITQWYAQKKIDQKTADKQLNEINRQLQSLSDALLSLDAMQKIKPRDNKIPAEEILAAKTWEEKRAAVLMWPYKIFARRVDEEVSMWFE